MIHALLVAGLASSSMAFATLPPPTAAAQQAAAAKKAAADAQAEQAKAQLAAAQDAISSRWRSRAAEQGWTARPPVAIAAAPAAGAPGTAAAPGAAAAPAGAPAAGSPAPNAANAAPVVPSSGAVPAAVQTTGVAVTGKPMPGVSPRATGVSANTITGTPAGNAAASPGGGAAPRSPQALQSATVPIKSEKLGTAAPSTDVKNKPTGSVKAGASPGVDKSIASGDKK